MNQKTAKAILNTDAGKALVQHIANTILELDSCKTKLVDDREISIEMKARSLAIEKLNLILIPFIEAKQEDKEGFDPKEYVV